MLICATYDTYITQRASGSPLVVGARGRQGLLPTLGAGVDHPLLPQTDFQSFTFGWQLVSNWRPLPGLIFMLGWWWRWWWWQKLTTGCCVLSGPCCCLVNCICSIAAAVWWKTFASDEEGSYCLLPVTGSLCPCWWATSILFLWSSSHDTSARWSRPPDSLHNPSGKSSRGRCSGHGLNVARVVSQQPQHPPGISTAAPFVFPSPSSVCPAAAGGCGDGGGGCCCSPQISADQHTSKISASSREEETGLKQHPARSLIGWEGDQHQLVSLSSSSSSSCKYARSKVGLRLSFKIPFEYL